LLHKDYYLIANNTFLSARKYSFLLILETRRWTVILLYTGLKRYYIVAFRDDVIF